MDPATALALAQAGYQIFSSFKKDPAQDNFSSAQQFSSAEAEKQRQWETAMFKSRHQMEVEDLRAAGLNPILSAGGQPPVPSGASAQAVTPDYGSYERQTLRMEQRMNAAKAISEIALNAAAKKRTDAETQRTQIENDWYGSSGGKLSRWIGMFTGGGIGVGSILGGLGNILKGANSGKSVAAAPRIGFSRG